MHDPHDTWSSFDVVSSGFCHTHRSRLPAFLPSALMHQWMDAFTMALTALKGVLCLRTDLLVSGVAIVISVRLF